MNSMSYCTKLLANVMGYGNLGIQMNNGGNHNRNSLPVDEEEDRVSNNNNSNLGSKSSLLKISSTAKFFTFNPNLYQKFHKSFLTLRSIIQIPRNLSSVSGKVLSILQRTFKGFNQKSLIETPKKEDQSPPPNNSKSHPSISSSFDGVSHCSTEQKNTSSNESPPPHIQKTESISSHSGDSDVESATSRNGSFQNAIDEFESYQPSVYDFDDDAENPLDERITRKSQASSILSSSESIIRATKASRSDEKKVFSGRITWNEHVYRVTQRLPSSVNDIQWQELLSNYTEILKNQTDIKSGVNTLTLKINLKSSEILIGEGKMPIKEMTIPNKEFITTFLNLYSDLFNRSKETDVENNDDQTADFPKMNADIEDRDSASDSSGWKKSKGNRPSAKAVGNDSSSTSSTTTRSFEKNSSNQHSKKVSSPRNNNSEEKQTPGSPSFFESINLISNLF